MTQSTALIDFFASYAETEGALAEEAPEGAVLMLTPELQAAYGLPEELILTEDPEAGREPGYQLLTAGHPLLRSAAEAVLTKGDTGHLHLPRITAPPPSPADLERRARDQVPVDHGRLDFIGAPSATYIPLVRLGASITFSLATDELVQELDEVYVLPDGQVVSDALLRNLEKSLLQLGLPQGCGPARVEAAVAAGHSQLLLRMERRAEELAALARHRVRARLEVVDDYYRRLLDSLEERQARQTDVGRAAILSQQVDATRVEWKLRKAEVAAELEAHGDLRPYRLHVLWLPAWDTSFVVRRGQRSYDLRMTYLPLGPAFLPPRCPSCGAAARLVAGKDRLECRQCAGAEHDSAAPASSPPVVKTARSSGALDDRGPGSSTKEPPETRPHPDKVASVKPKPAARSGRATPKGSGGRVTARANERRLEQIGDRLTSLLWRSLFFGDLPRARDVVRWSAVDALFRLYGTSTPALAIGLDEGESVDRWSFYSVPTSQDGVYNTMVRVFTDSNRQLSLSINWRVDTGRMLVIEMWPLERLRHVLTTQEKVAVEIRERYSDHLRTPPLPTIPLAPGGWELLSRSAELGGLGYASRCLAAWWWLTESPQCEDEALLDELSPAVLAAAVEALVAKRAQIRVTAPALAQRYGCKVDELRRELRGLQDLASKAPAAGW
jgi:hypothetical protein